MHYVSFMVSKYRAINNLEIKLDSKLIPLVGINECGKTTILQAIYSFDYLNDSEYEERHIKSIRNLYDTTHTDSVVSAKVKITNEEILSVIEEIIDEIEAGRIQLSEGEESFVFDLEEATKGLSPIESEVLIEVSRNVTKKTYSTNWNYQGLLNNATVQNAFCKEIVRKMPYILYNDDFADRPPAEITIPNEKPDKLSGWLAIYERLFNSTAPGYSLFNLINETDTLIRASILSDVETELNSTLSTAWKSFSAEKGGAIKVSLSINDAPQKILQIKIVEEVDGKSRHFDVLDRSKGFVWHYNFIMKTQFNPKIVGKVEDTIFLLDEPGSYLHSTAQEKLCSKLSEISKKYGIVIYCTHSHHLLNPKVIPLKNILIVEKNKKKVITTTPLPRYKTRSENTSALQPVYEALNIPVHEVFSNNDELLLVEGINDKYVIETFTTLPENVRILPGTSADSILKNIPYMIAYDKKFQALWDNDSEGQKAKKYAMKEFNLNDNLLKLLPLEGYDKRRMEHMFTRDDLSMMARFSDLPSDASYDVIIPTVFFLTKKEQQKILNGLSDKAKKSFEILEKVISKSD